MPPLKVYLAALVITLGCGAVQSGFAACTAPAGSAGKVIFNSTQKVMQYCNGTDWVNTGAVIASAAQTSCAGPAGTAGSVIFNAALGVIQFCNGSSWVDTACAATRTPGGSGCTSPVGKAGAMHYETSSNEMQFCDSTSWVAMGWPCGGVGGGGGGGGGVPDGPINWAAATLYQTVTGATAFTMLGNSIAMEGNTLLAKTTTTVDVYTKSGGTWTKRTGLPVQGDVLDMNGTTVAIGGESGSPPRGEVFIYTGSDASWSQQAKLVPADRSDNDQFGALGSIDTDTIAIATNPSVTTPAPATYIFTRSGAVWTQQAKLIPTVGANYVATQPVTSIAVSGNTLAIGARTSGPSGAGAVFIFTRSGSVWTQVATLLSPDSSDFGSSVVFNGSQLLISSANAVYVYTGAGASWTRDATLIDLDPDTMEPRIMGFIMSSSGNLLVATLMGLPQGGGVRIFEKSGANWVPKSTFLDTDVVGSTQYIFGMVHATNGTDVVAADMLAPSMGYKGQLHFITP